MKLVRTLLVAILQTLLFASLCIAQQVSYNDVLVVVNRESEVSEEIGRYFAERRGIPERQICRITTSTSHTIDSMEMKEVQWQIEGYLREQRLSDSINYIVTTKGCPLRVVTEQQDDPANGVWGGTASFEDCLVLINGADSALMLGVKHASSPAWTSRYFDARTHFRRSAGMPIYLVTRLDGYTVDHVRGLIHRAERPASVGEGVWVLDMAPGMSEYMNGGMRRAGELLSGRGLRVEMNQDSEYLRHRTEVVGYVSWGSNDPGSGGGAAAMPENAWLNGAIAETFVGLSARTYSMGLGQSMVAEWLDEGVSGMKGYTDYPAYSAAMARPQILFDRYSSGFNMAESFYAASRYVAWRQVIVGDPKMQLAPRHLIVSKRELDLGGIARYGRAYDTIRITNISNRSLLIDDVTIDSSARAAFGVDGLRRSPLPRSIGAGDSALLLVIFGPTSFGLDSALLHIRYRAVSDTLQRVWEVTLRGRGEAPLLEAPREIRFRPAGGSTAIYDTVVLRNRTLSDTVTISALKFTGPGARSFALQPPPSLPLAIPGGGEVKLPLQYDRRAGDSGVALLEIYSNASRSVELVELRGPRGDTGAIVSYDDLLVVINMESDESQEIGEYFAARRGVPEEHICRISTSDDETIDSMEMKEVQWQIEGYLREQRLSDSINYIVTTKGCPLRVVTEQQDDPANGVWGGTASFEDCLVLINGADSALMLGVKHASSPAWTSRYFDARTHFRRSAGMPIYLVTRLDGYTVDHVRGLIHRAERPASVGEGVWVLDMAPGMSEYMNGGMRRAGELLSGRGLRVEMNQDSEYLRHRTEVVGYVSWGSNDPGSGGGAAAMPENAWLNGAIAETHVSTGARSFIQGTEYGQSLIADLIAEGVSAVKGYTDEPTGGAMAHADILFDRYSTGFNMAESFYAAARFSSWRQVVIGDPKMQLGVRLPAGVREPRVASRSLFTRIPLWMWGCGALLVMGAGLWIRRRSGGMG